MVLHHTTQQPQDWQHIGTLTCMLCVHEQILGSPGIYTWLLIELMPKGEVFFLHRIDATAKPVAKRIWIVHVTEGCDQLRTPPLLLSHPTLGGLGCTIRDKRCYLFTLNFVRTLQSRKDAFAVGGMGLG